MPDTYLEELDEDIGTLGFIERDTGDGDGLPAVSARELQSISYDGVSLSNGANMLLARAMMPYGRASSDVREQYIDSTVLAMMLACESMMIKSGDVWEAFGAQIDLSSGIIVSHEDKSVQDAYKDWLEAVNIDYILEDAGLCRATYGNSYIVYLGEGDSSAVTTLNPKYVAVGRQMSYGTRPVAFFPNSKDPADLISEFFHQKVLGAEWNEWQQQGRGGMPLNPRRVVHSTVRKMHHQRYGIPPLIRAWDNLQSRTAVAEMVRSTAEGIKAQIRFWRIENPVRGEIPRLVSQLRSLRPSKTYDLVWRNNLEMESIVPGSVSELLATDTWMSYTFAVFRDLGMFIRLVSGESPSIRSSSDTGVEVEVNVALSRIQREQRTNASIVRSLCKMYAQYGDKSLADKNPPKVGFAHSELSTMQRVKSMVPVMNFGVVSLQTIHETLGLDHEIEMARLKSEKELRESGIVAPYPGFAQTSNGRTTTSPNSPGRPQGRDDTPGRERKSSD